MSDNPHADLFAWLQERVQRAETAERLLVQAQEQIDVREITIERLERQLEQSLPLIFIGQAVITDAIDHGWKHGDEGAYEFMLRIVYEKGKKCT